MSARFSSSSERSCGSWVEFAHNGNAFKVSRRSSASRVGGGTRGDVSHFSSRSRKQLLLTLNAVDRLEAEAGRWVFVTLTYHLREVTARETKSHLSNFKKRLMRRFGRDVCGVWKLEPQKRGKPHFHLLLHHAGRVDPDVLRAFIVEHWHAIADPDSPEHLRCMEFVGRTAAGRRRDFFQPMRSWGEVAGYAAKYCGKVIDNDPDWLVPGRFWGIINKRAFALLSTIRRVRVSEAAAIWVARQLRRFLSHRHTGRVDIIAQGRRLTLHRTLCKVPGFVDAQESFARFVGGHVKRYRYRPKNTRNRSGFASDAIVSKLVEHAQRLHPIGHAELVEDASRDLDRFMRPHVDARVAAVRLHRAMPRIASSMYWGKRQRLDEPPPPARVAPPPADWHLFPLTRTPAPSALLARSPD